MKEKQDNNLNLDRGLHKCSKESGEISTINFLNLTLLPKIAVVSDCQYVFKPLTESR